MMGWHRLGDLLVNIHIERRLVVDHQMGGENGQGLASGSLE